MKFSVEVEIGWINEESGIDEEVLTQVQDKLVDKIFKVIEKQVTEKISDTVNSILDAKIMQTYDDFLTKEFTTYDRWGDVQKEKVSVKDILKDKLDAFMTSKVDKEGNTTNYSGEYRYKQILDKQAQAQIDKFLSALSSKVIEGIKSDINAEAVKKITDSILSDYSLKKLINPMV